MKADAESQDPHLGKVHSLGRPLIIKRMQSSITNRVQHGTDSSIEDLWTGFRDRICKPFIHERPKLK